MKTRSSDHRRSNQSKSANPIVRVYPETYAALQGIKDSRRGMTHPRILDAIVADFVSRPAKARDAVLGAGSRAS